MKDLNNYANQLKSYTNYKEMGRIYFLLMLFIISITALFTALCTILLIDQLYPELFLLTTIINFYTQILIPNTFRYLLVPIAISVLNIYFLIFLKKWYLLFLFLEIMLLFLFKQNIIAINLLEYSSLILNIGIVVLTIYGLLIYIYHEKLMEMNKKNRDKAQTLVYKEFIVKHRFLNLINFIINSLSIYVGSHTISVTGIKLIILCISSWSLAVFMILNDLFRIEMILGLTLMATSFRYESLHANYHQNFAFKKNFDVNARYWTMKLAKSNNVIARYYCTQVIKAAVNKVGTFTLINPTRRTVFVIGGGFVFCGLLTAGVYTYKISENTKIELAKIASGLEVAKMEHEEKMKQIENAKNAGWNFPWWK